MVYSNRKQLFSKSWREKQKKLFYRNSVTVINKFCALCRHASNFGVKKYSLDFPFVSGWRSRVNYWFCFFALHSFIRLLPSTCHANHAFYTSRFNLWLTILQDQSFFILSLVMTILQVKSSILSLADNPIGSILYILFGWQPLICS